MIKLFKTILKAGTPTAKYPFAPYEVNRDFRGKPKYQADQCIACAACTKACPANALVMEVDMETGERRWEISMARCIFCGRCEEVCPTRAIALSPEFELAVTNKADLYEEARFALAPLHPVRHLLCPEQAGGAGGGHPQAGRHTAGHPGAAAPLPRLQTKTEHAEPA